MLTPIETIALEWLCSAVALSFVLARLWVRVRVRQFQFWLSDLLLLAGLGCSIGSSACDTLEYLVGDMTNFSHPGEYLGKIRFAEKFLFDTGLYLPKLSLVLSYEKIVPRTSPRLRLYLRCIAAYVGLGAITATAADAFWCGSDPSINWTNPQQCSSFTNAHLQKVTWALNILGELLLFIFPFSLLKSLQLAHFRERVGLAVILVLGITTLVVSTVRFLFMILLVNDISLAVWTTAELSLSVVVVSTLALGPILRRIGHTAHKLRPLAPPHQVPGSQEKNSQRTETVSASVDPDLDRSLETQRAVFVAKVEGGGGEGTCGRRARGELLLPPPPPPPEDEDTHQQDPVLPRPTAAWYKWPVDLDVDSMCVTAVMDTRARAAEPSSRWGGVCEEVARTWEREQQEGEGCWKAWRMWGRKKKKKKKKKRDEVTMVSRGTQTLGRVVVELDIEGLPYGSRL